MTRPRTLVIGHRGAPGYRPEHTRSSYTLALASGVDAVEPDVVATRDGVLVVRHENEISGTTDVAERTEFADRRTTRMIDGEALTGWFTEDFTWDELATLRCRERLPEIRSTSASFDGQEPILRLVDVLDLVREAGAAAGRAIGVVLEIKHATHFRSIGLDLVPLVLETLQDAGWAAGALPLYVESFEQDVLSRLRSAGLPATYVYLLESSGRPYDLVSAHGDAAATYVEQMSPSGLDRLAADVDGISLDKRTILAPDRLGRPQGPSSVVADAHQRGLRVFTWTARPENAFLLRAFRDGAKGDFGDYEAEWAVLRDAGVDGVFVDHADLGVAFFR